MFYLFLFFILIQVVNAQEKNAVVESIKFDTTSIPILMLESLLNTKYDVGSAELIELSNGVYENSVGLGGEHIVKYKMHISCELNGDKLIDAIIVLVETLGGGSGVFQHIIPVINMDGRPLPFKGFELPDRTHINSIYKKGSTVYLDLLVHDITDGACCPSKKETWKLEFKKDRFIKIN